MTKSYRPHLELLRAALRQIRTYTPGDEGDFVTNQMAQDAILMRLQEIGENLTRMRNIDSAFFTEVASDSWYQLIGLRNIITHGYDLIDATQIWQVLTEELDAFAASIEEFERSR
jgi:uncharacterized protein with HEPN domain